MNWQAAVEAFGSPPSRHQVCGSSGPAREMKIKSGPQQPSGNDAAALQNKFCFRAQKPSAELEEGPGCRQADSGSPGLPQ